MPLGDVINYIQKSAAGSLAAQRQRRPTGEGLRAPATFSGIAVPYYSCRLRHVCHPRHSLRELCASRYRAFDSVPRCCGWADDALAVQQHAVALLSDRTVPLMGIVKKNGIDDRGLCAPSSR